MNEHTPHYPDSQSKKCARCHQVKPVTEFYERTGIYKGQPLSECKACMKERSRQSVRLPRTETRVPHEALALDALRKAGIHAVSGKAVYAADVDIVAFGCVRIEVKYSKLDRRTHHEHYSFTQSATQVSRGFLAEIVLLMCDNGERITYHLFPANDPVFYIKGRLKTAVNFTPGSTSSKHDSNRVVMTQAMMDRAENRWPLIWYYLKAQSDALKQEAS